MDEKLLLAYILKCIEYAHVFKLDVLQAESSNPTDTVFIFPCQGDKFDNVC